MNSVTAIAIALMVLGGSFALANWWNLFWSYHTKRFHSTVPFIGAVMLGAGMLMTPATYPYAWTSVLLDYGTLILLLSAPQLVHEFWSTCRINMLREYLGETDTKTVRLCLFKHCVFTMRIDIRRGAGECGLINTGMIGRWSRNNGRLTLNTGSESAVFDVINDMHPEGLRQSSGFPSWEAQHELSLASIHFAQTKS